MEEIGDGLSCYEAWSLSVLLLGHMVLPKVLYVELYEMET